jgi:hypothetical protein
MRRAALILAIALVGACSADPPDLSLIRYGRAPIDDTGFYLDIDQTSARVMYTQGDARRMATLTEEAQTLLYDATAQIEAAWDPPYECSECLNAEYYLFDSDTGRQSVMNFYLSPRPFMQPLRSAVDRLIIGIQDCSGPLVERCFEPL